MPMTDERTRPYQMRVTEEWLAIIDEWRRKQPDLPSRAEAIRRLVDRGLKSGEDSAPPKSVKIGSF